MSNIISVIAWPFKKIISIVSIIYDMFFIVLGVIFGVIAFSAVIAFILYWVVAIVFGASIVFAPFIEHWLK